MADYDTYFLVFVPACHRNQSHQEQLWEISCNLLKDYLSPDILREYGPSEMQPPTGAEQVAKEE